MPSLKSLAEKEGAFAGGHRMCAGCPVPVFTRMLTRVTDYEIVVCSATGCLEVASSIFPYTAWKTPWVHTAFENAAATMSGVEAAYKALKKKGKIDKNIKFVVIGGDGGTYDIGLQSLSGAMERGHDMLYICYDNGAYMNTGIQRSGATPLGAATTTSPATDIMPGKTRNRKDLTSIMSGHGIGYIAQASVHDPVDLSDKIKKGIEHNGPAFLNIFSPCVPGWGIAPEMSIEAARAGVEAKYWPLFEIIEGKYIINYRPKTEVSLKEWVLSQGRFKHLKDPKWAYMIDDLQKYVDEQWARLERMSVQ
jgi:pyruvate ferredoxin oxidoreductase beta subunit